MKFTDAIAALEATSQASKPARLSALQLQAEIASGHALGLTDAALADKLGVSRPRVQQLRKALGLKASRGGHASFFSPAVDAAILQYADDGYGWAEIARIIGLDASHRGRVRDRYDLLDDRRTDEPEPEVSLPLVQNLCLRCRAPFSTPYPKHVRLCDPCRAINMGIVDVCHATHGVAFGES